MIIDHKARWHMAGNDPCNPIESRYTAGGIASTGQ